MGDLKGGGSTVDIDQPAPREWSAGQREALSLWIALARCYSSFAKAVSVKIHEYGLTTPQFGVLEALYHLGPLPLGDLAEKLLVTGGNVTYVMDRLEQQDLVYRERSEDDRRVIQAKLTPEGRALIEGVFQGHAEYIEHLTRHIEADERAELRELLKKLGKGVARQDL